MLAIISLPRTDSTLLLNMIGGDMCNEWMPQREFEVGKWVHPDHWIEINKNFNPEYILLTRDIKDVAASYVRSQKVADPAAWCSLDRLTLYADKLFWFSKLIDYKQVKYEDLVTNPESIEDYLEVKFEPYSKEWFKTRHDEVVRHSGVDQSSIGHWKQYKDICLAVEEQCMPYQELFGYA